MPNVLNQFWQRTDKSLVINKPRNTITLEPFSADCGWFATNSARLTGDGSFYNFIYHTITNNNDPIDAVSVEAWIKLNNYPSDPNGKAVLFYRECFAIQKQVRVAVNSDGYIEFSLKKGGVDIVLTSSKKVSTGNWTFITASWDGTTMEIFQDGVKDDNRQALSGNLDACLLPVNNIIGWGLGTVTAFFNGSIAEVRIWNSGRTSQDILNTMFGIRNYNYGSGIDDDLIYYYRLNEGSGIVVNELVNSETGTITVYGVNTGLVNDDGPPLIYGSSFVAAEFDVTLTQKCSLVYPISGPENVNFALVVRWEDEDDNIHRRVLWMVDGVNIDPSIKDYAGERLPLLFTLECYNIDGQATIDLDETLILDTSIRTLPTTSKDVVKPNLATLISTDLLAVNLPITFPIVFNIQQNFILPSGVVPPIPTNIGNALGESGAVLGEGSTGLQ